LRDYSQFSAIKHFELLNFEKRDSTYGPNVQTVVEAFNHTCLGVVNLILQQESIRDRANVYCKFIRIAQRLRNLNNFHTLMAIITALNNNAVMRLKKTLEKIPRSFTKILEELTELMSNNENYIRYRKVISVTPPPCIPFIGLPLRDISMIEDSNSSYCRGSLINFSKRKLVYNVLSQVCTFKQVPYNLHAVPEIYELFPTLFFQVEESDLWKRSEQLEQRKPGATSPCILTL